VQGTLEPSDDKWLLRFERKLPHTPDKVWQALTDPKHLIAWFPTTIEGERAAGAALTFSFPGGRYPAIEGEMLAYDPPSLLEFRWGDDDVIRFSLRPDGEGTVLTLLNTFDKLGKASRDAAGWHDCLDQLGHHLSGEEAPWGPGERWGQYHESYVERFGEEASTIGPPEGHRVNQTTG
jgi:uncharacterized protein YndB with AHSA1/START domain